MDLRLKYKKNYKTAIKKHKKKLLDAVMSKDFLDTTWKTQITKQNQVELHQTKKSAQQRK